MLSSGCEEQQAGQEAGLGWTRAGWEEERSERGQETTWSGEGKGPMSTLAFTRRKEGALCQQGLDLTQGFTGPLWLRVGSRLQGVGMRAESPGQSGSGVQAGEDGGWARAGQWLSPAMAAYQGVGETLSSAMSFHPLQP